MVAGEVPFGLPNWEPCKPLKVLLIEKEIGPYMIGDRMASIFRGLPRECTTDRFKIMSRPPGFYLSLADTRNQLKGIVKEEAIDVLLLDPINKLHFFDENDARQGLQLIDAIEQIQGESIGVVYSHHYKKPPRGRDLENYDPLDLYNIRGMARHVEDADAVLTLDRLPGMIPGSRAEDSWVLEGKIILRHGPSPPDFVLHVNEFDDLRVHYIKERTVPERRQRRSSPKEYEDRTFIQ